MDNSSDTLKRQGKETDNKSSPKKKVKLEETLSTDINFINAVQTAVNDSLKHLLPSILVDLNIKTEKSTSVRVFSALEDALPNRSRIDLLEICNLYGYKQNDIVSTNEFDALMGQIYEHHFIDIQQASASLGKSEQAEASGGIHDHSKFSMFS